MGYFTAFLPAHAGLHRVSGAPYAQVDTVSLIPSARIEGKAQ
ncbi:hypothetical protein [Aeromonas hydrophila]|nr:hypothetical protein [Aeromonas hydrophila]